MAGGDGTTTLPAELMKPGHIDQLRIVTQGVQLPLHNTTANYIPPGTVTTLMSSSK